MNGININHFQFEYDLTWMSFFQNHAGQTYLRYGGREDVGPESHLNKDSLLGAMKEALKLHKENTPREFSRFEPASDSVKTPEQIPSTQKIIAKRQNKCIHCHEVKSALLSELRASGNLNKNMVFTYPSPLNLGIELDSVQQNSIKKIQSDTPAQAASLRIADRLQSLDGQPVFTFADVTRVLELAPDQGTLKVVISREGTSQELEINLPDKWKTIGDPSWRESTHIVGPNSGFWGVPLNEAQRQSLRIKDDKLAIKATAIWGQWAKQAGVKHGDVITSIDGQSKKMGIKQLQTYLQMNKSWGDQVTIEVLRKRQPIEMTMTLPEQPKD